MNTLYNANGEQIPPRPELTNEIMKAGVLKAVNHMQNSIDDDYIESFANDIAKFYEYGSDAYELAKSMDDHGLCWHVDTKFVEDMEVVDRYIRGELDSAVKEWANTYQPVPPFEVGTELQEYSFSTDIHGGFVDGICQHTPATYLVKMHDRAEDDTSRRLVKFEDARLRHLNVGDVVAPIRPDYHLARGRCRYETAVVVSVEPFVLVSHAADRRWQSTVKRERFKIVGTVEGDDLARCLTRL
ncbi:TPA: hypothetical protein ACGU7J_001657 [Vibrio vulnificus]